MSATLPVIAVEGVEKSYSGIAVLKEVSLAFEAASVHGLVGENGAGKSTLARIMAGAVSMDRGTIFIDGAPVVIRSPRDALRHGVTMITQELSLVPQLTVVENVFLGQLDHRLGLVTNRKTYQRYLELVGRVGFDDFAPGERVSSLSRAKQQQVELLRALARSARVLIMDEPTASLSEVDAGRLLDVIRRLRSDGVCVIFISHSLDEVLSVADRVAVLRDGALVVSAPSASHTAQSLVQHMVGRAVDVGYLPPAPVDHDAPVVLTAVGLTRGRKVQGVDLRVRRGEIVGLAGLVGSGRSEAARLIFGAERADGGAIEVNGETLRQGTIVGAMAAGVAMVPESRKAQGLVLVRPVRENISMASLKVLSTGGFVRRVREQQAAASAAQQTDIRGASLEAPAWSLSGGNQQKALFAKWLMRRPSILIADEPTQGVDVAAKSQIHGLLEDLARRGTAILLISSEIEELTGLCHRILVMRQGRIVAEFLRDQWSTAKILAAAFAQPAAEEQ